MDTSYRTRELGLQREELALTRGQLGKQTELLQEQVTAAYQDSIPRLTLRKVLPQGDWEWVVENKGGDAKNIELLNLNTGHTVHKRNSMARGEQFQFVVEAAGDIHSYEARFGSERSERFRQRWEIGKGNYKEVTHGPESLEG